MKLSVYLGKKGGGALSRLADELQVSRGFLSDVAAGKKDCSMAMARMIRAATRGWVTPNDLADARADFLNQKPKARPRRAA